MLHGHSDLSGGGWPSSKDDLFILKKYLLINEKRLLTFKEMFEIDNEVIFGTGNYLEHGIEIINNTEEELRELSEEMNQKLNGTWAEEAGDVERQQLWKKQLKQYYSEHNLNFFDAVQINLGDTFLRKNRKLLCEI